MSKCHFLFESLLAQGLEARGVLLHWERLVPPPLAVMWDARSPTWADKRPPMVAGWPNLPRER